MKEVDFLNRVQLISSKPVVYLVNLPEKAYIKKKSKWLPKVPQPLRLRCACSALPRAPARNAVCPQPGSGTA